jgi:DNA-directed RNA polymerase subunit RPC12/RpoP
MPIELYVCASCGTPLNELLPQELQEAKITE